MVVYIGRGSQMKKKKQNETVVVDENILAQAKAALQGDKVKPAIHCVICDAEAAPNSTENLCWVCRRLKISAWRDSSDQQLGAQE